MTEGEAERHAEFTRAIVSMQTRANRKHGPGRAFHRQQIAGVAAELVVHENLPELSQGLFAQPGTHAAVVRMSHGGIVPHPDAVPDIQGFAISVRGISGPGALAPQTDRQDFLLINRPAFGFATSAEFAEIAVAAAKGQVELAKAVIGRHGPVRGPLVLAELSAGMLRPFTGFATTTFHSAAPIAYGPYAVMVRAKPVGARLDPRAALDNHGDIARRLRGGALAYDIGVQFFLDEDTTPIEDLREAWPSDRSPWHTVARLTLPQRDIESAEGLDLADQIEADHFDPWSALADHRPLGEVMRARKAAYFASVSNRRAADEDEQ